MKIVKQIKTGELQKVNDVEADNLVRTKQYVYAPKSAWKAVKAS